MRLGSRKLLLASCILWAATIVSGRAVAQSSVAASCPGNLSGDTRQCPVDRPCFDSLTMSGNALQISWSATEAFDHFNFRWSRPGRDESQQEVSGGRQGSFSINNANRCVKYTLKVQGCNKPLIGSSTCTPWAEEQFTPQPPQPSGPDTCTQGFVWRDAFPGDHVCVQPQVRDQAAADNQQAANRRNPSGGQFGADTCRQGFVWREARAQDHVCVIPAVRTQTQNDNAAKCSRLARC